MRTTFFTCCSKEYEDFIPIFIHSSLYHNKLDIDVEICVEDPENIDKNILDSIIFLRNKYPNNKIKIRTGNFKGITLGGKFFKIIPHVVRFIEMPKITNDFIYICDIDIIVLQKNIQEIHINDMCQTGLNYSNIVRPNFIDEFHKRLTGLHFAKWDSYYPIPKYKDLAINQLLNNDEIFLYQLVKKKNLIDEKHTFRPVHGIHVSQNREDIKTWGINNWKNEWITYRNSTEFLQLEKCFSEKIIQIIKRIDEYYEQH